MVAVDKSEGSDLAEVETGRKKWSVVDLGWSEESVFDVGRKVGSDINEVVLDSGKNEYCDVLCITISLVDVLLAAAGLLGNTTMICDEDTCRGVSDAMMVLLWIGPTFVNVVDVDAWSPVEVSSGP